MSKVIYCEASFMMLCLLAFLYIQCSVKHNNVYTKSMRMVIIAVGIGVISDSIWYLIDGNPSFIWLNWLTNIITNLCEVTFGYQYACYCCETSKITLWKNKRQRFVYVFPCIIASINAILSIFTKWAFYVDEMGLYHRGPTMTLTVVCAIIAPICISINAIGKLKIAQSKAERARLLLLACFPIPPILFSMIQFLLPPGLSTIHCGVILSLIYIFFETQDSLITRDFLTGKANRFALDHYLTEKVSRYQNGYGDAKALYLLMADSDKLKSINDTYGHAEGDKVIQVTAKILSEVCLNCGGFLGRIGGDEFAMVIESNDYHKVLKIKDEIYRRFEEYEKNCEYKFSISIGLAEYDGVQPANKFMEEADKELYKVKNRKKQMSEKSE